MHPCQAGGGRPTPLGRSYSRPAAALCTGRSRTRSQPQPTAPACGPLVQTSPGVDLHSPRSAASGKLRQTPVQPEHSPGHASPSDTKHPSYTNHPGYTCHTSHSGHTSYTNHTSYTCHTHLTLHLPRPPPQLHLPHPPPQPLVHNHPSPCHPITSGKAKRAPSLPDGLPTWLDTCVCLVAQACPTLCDPMDCSLSGASVHGIFQPRILEWVAISFSRFDA